MALDGSSTGIARTDVAIAVIVDDGRVLICRRPANTSFPGCWEFPGGKRETGESLEQCLVREVREELDIEITPLYPLTPVDHDYAVGSIRLHPYVCAHERGEPRPIACDLVKWVSPLALREHQFPPANGPLLAEVLCRLATQGPSRGPAG